MKRLDQHFHVFGNLSAAEGRNVRMVIRRVVQASGDLTQPLMSFGQVVSFVSVFLEGTLDLELQALEITAFIQRFWQSRQGLLNSFQLLISHQPAPVKRLAAAAVHRIPNSLAAVLFKLLEFSLPGSG